MKIALLGENYFPTLGGIQEHIYHLARQLRQRGHDARVLTGLPPEDGPWRGPRDEPWVMRLGRARRYSIMGSRTTLTFGPRIAANLKRTLTSEKFDLVHVHAPCDMGLPALFFGIHRGRVVATLHSPMNGASWPRRLAAPYYHHILSRRCDAVISVSETAHTAMRRFARFESRIIPNGVDTQALAAGRPLPQFQDGKTNVLMLGRLEPRNGPDIMFKALPSILARRPDVRLLVAGAGKNGIKDHQEMVPEAMRHQVVFLGPVYEERADVYASARLCVIPARAGTFSIIVLEALAAGAPIVATPFVQSWRSERHFEAVKVTADFTPESIADGVVQALAEDPTARIAKGKEIAASFDWSRVADQVLGVYEEVLDRRGAPGVQGQRAQSTPPISA